MHAARSPVILGGLREDRVSIGIGNIVTIVIASTVGNPRLYATSGHPGGKTAWVVVSSIICLAECALAVSSTSKFSAPDNQGVFQHASLFQILDQSCTCLVCLFALLFDSIFDIAVMIPAGVVKLTESYTSFGKSSR